MRHLLMDPFFPDLVGVSAAEYARPRVKGRSCDNDNHSEQDDEVGDPLLTMLGKLDVEATRIW